MRRATVSAWLAGAAALAAGAGDAVATDKSAYSLFNPTPERLLRDMTTDRPDTTESPFTVDAGRVQVETHVFGFERVERGGDAVESYELGTTNVRIGVTNNAEVGFVWQPYGVVRMHQGTPAATLRDAGIGGLELRAKFNFWGNDTFDRIGATALAVLPFVSFPTDRDNGISPEHIEGGLIVPLAIKVSDKIGLGLNAGVAYTRDDFSAGYRPEYLASASLSYEWSDKLGTYYEIAARFHTAEPEGDVVILGTGLTYKLTKNIQLDAGVNFGIASSTDRINPFVGVSTRF
jgi:opacity protein-like surface antigen